VAYPEKEAAMDIREEIAARVDKLPADLQVQVLRFVSSLAAPTPRGQSGSTLRQFSGCLDHGTAQEMLEAIQEGCERVDAIDW
jgi:hypothetical protein